MRGKETIVIQRVGEPDRSGDRQPAGAPFEIKSCFVIPVTIGVDSERGERIVSGFTVVAPRGTDLRSTDEATIRGNIFGVDGVPGDFGAKGVIAVFRRAGDVDAG